MLVPKLRFKEYSDKWGVDKLCDVTSYVDYRGKTPKKMENGIFLITAKNIKKGYIDYNCSKEYVSENAYEEIMRRGLPSIGDILITTEAPCGNVAQVDNANVALAQRIIKYSGNSNIDNTYLKYELLSDRFQTRLNKVSTGGTVSGVKGSVLHKLSIYYPSLNEQRKIGAFLSLLDKKIKLQQEKIDALKLYKKGLLLDLFQNKNNTTKVKISDITICKSSSITLIDIENNSGIHGIYGANGIIKQIDFYKYAEPYIAIVKDGASVGYNYICKEKSSILGTLNALFPLNCDLYYLKEILSNLNFSKYIVGSGIPHIYYNDYKKESVYIHDSKIQEKIGLLSKNIEQLIIFEKLKSNELFELKKGLIQNMFA